ncbi:MAG: DUF4469 domain-containing protein [Treponema sp.]|jgi:hypothetical protein|nr:DUF4469 domain-containing protein [Treponema sp.]
MPIAQELNEVLHRIRVKLYPNYLPQVEGKYIARTNSEAMLSIGQICASLKNRGGFTGNADDLIAHVGQFMDEAAYQLCDGFAVNLKYFSVHPNIGGTFNSAKEAHDPAKHPVTFRFRARKPLRSLIQAISVEIQGVANASGCITEFYDFELESANALFAPGDMFAVYGSKIKLAGGSPEVGVYFVPVDDPSMAVKASRIAENLPSKITGIAPKTGFSDNRIEIRTQYSNSNGILLKTPRVIKSGFIREES